MWFNGNATSVMCHRNGPCHWDRYFTHKSGRDYPSHYLVHVISSTIGRHHYTCPNKKTPSEVNYVVKKVIE